MWTKTHLFSFNFSNEFRITNARCATTAATDKLTLNIHPSRAGILGYIKMIIAVLLQSLCFNWLKVIVWLRRRTHANHLMFFYRNWMLASSVNGIRIRDAWYILWLMPTHTRLVGHWKRIDYKWAYHEETCLAPNQWHCIIWFYSRGYYFYVRRQTSSQSFVIAQWPTLTFISSKITIYGGEFGIVHYICFCSHIWSLRVWMELLGKRTDID